MKLAGPLLCIALLAGPLPPAAAQERKVYDAAKNHLVTLFRRELVKAGNPTRAAKADYFGIYFASGSDQASRDFTPKLINFYDKYVNEFGNFEFIYVSQDASAEDMADFMYAKRMRWPGLDFENAQWVSRIQSYAGDGIPHLVFVNAAGEVLAATGNGTTPYDVLEVMERTLARAAAERAAELAEETGD